MQILGVALIIIGIKGIADPLIYFFSERFYEKHSDAEKQYRYELLDVIYKRKRARSAAFVLGIVCVLLGVMFLLRL